jgi:hypothetical protein
MNADGDLSRRAFAKRGFSRSSTKSFCRVKKADSFWS